MSEPLNDPRLEAAAEIVAAWYSDAALPPQVFIDLFHAKTHDDAPKRTLTTALRVTGADDLAAALGWFLEDPRFQVAVGGNPNVVDRMLADARAALAKYKELKQ